MAKVCAFLFFLSIVIMMMPTIVNEYKPGDDEILYHYCSAETFYNIVKSKTLWLCDIRHMNDSEELTYGEKLFWTLLDEMHIPLKMQNNIKNVYDQFRNQIVLLSISFSKSDEILSQWRGYANDAKGFCIGFDARLLISELPFCPLKVIYNNNEQKELMKRVINLLLSHLNDNKLHILYLISQLIEVFAQVKHPSFCEEKECRLTHALIINEDGMLHDAVREECPGYSDCLHDISFRLVNNIPTPYVCVDFPKTKSFVKKVIIGSKNLSDINDIELFLNYAGINKVEIKKYNSSYNIF